MIEVVFNEGAAGALKSAGVVKRGSIISGVAELMLMLDTGDISDMNAAMGKRKELLDALYPDFPGVSDAIWKTNEASLRQLEEAKKTPEPVRMWVCAGNPAELCGMYYVCGLMAGSPLSAVFIPEQIEKDGCIVSCRGTEDIAPEEFGSLVVYEEPVSELRRDVYAGVWNRLVRENAPLRAVVNGSLMGVSEDFYDFALRANMPDGECVVAQLIGKTMGSVRGVNDRWLFMRVQSMLQSGELAEVCPASGDYPYSGVVKKSGGVAI